MNVIEQILDGIGDLLESLFGGSRRASSASSASTSSSSDEEIERGLDMASLGVSLLAGGRAGRVDRSSLVVDWAKSKRKDVVKYDFRPGQLGALVTWGHRCNTYCQEWLAPRGKNHCLDLTVLDTAEHYNRGNLSWIHRWRVWPMPGAVSGLQDALWSVDHVRPKYGMGNRRALDVDTGLSATPGGLRGDYLGPDLGPGRYWDKKPYPWTDRVSGRKAGVAWYPGDFAFHFFNQYVPIFPFRRSGLEGEKWKTGDTDETSGVPLWMFASWLPRSDADTPRGNLSSAANKAGQIVVDTGLDPFGVVSGLRGELPPWAQRLPHMGGDDLWRPAAEIPEGHSLSDGKWRQGVPDPSQEGLWGRYQATLDWPRNRFYSQRVVPYILNCRWLVTAADWARECHGVAAGDVWRRHAFLWGVGVATSDARKAGLMRPSLDPSFYGIPKQDVAELLEYVRAITPPLGAVPRSVSSSKGNDPFLENVVGDRALPRTFDFVAGENESPCVDWPRELTGALSPQFGVDEDFLQVAETYRGSAEAKRDAQVKAFHDGLQSALRTITSLGAGLASAGASAAEAVNAALELAEISVELYGVISGSQAVALALPAIRLAKSCAAGDELGLDISEWASSPAASLQSLVDHAQNQAVAKVKGKIYKAQVDLIKDVQGWAHTDELFGAVSTVPDIDLGLD